MIKFTLWGLYQYDPTIFDNAPLPSGIDKQLVIDTIMDNSGDLYCYYQQPERFKLSITNWFRRHEHGFSRMILALLKEYDPLENYDRYEDETTSPDITRSRALGGKDSTQLSGTDRNSASGSDKVTTDMNETTENIGKVSAFDSSTFENKDHTDNIADTNGTVETDYGRTDSTTYGRKDETTYGRTDTERETGATDRILHAHGNIGTTQNSEMLRNELEIRRFDLYKTIAQMFEDDLLIQVY